MTFVTLNSKYQIVIPKKLREKIKPGQRIIIREIGGIIHLIPDLPFKELKGLFRIQNLDFKGLRDK